ncbi:MAG: response regulator [Prevotella sp.]|nr:response regulator [Prevotella sp.]
MKTILIAEDNDSNYTLMTYILRRKYNYERAVNGREAVERVTQGGIDLVLMDINMPVMDGLEATRIIKRGNPKLPIVAVTANAFETDMNLTLKAGCDACLTKPVSSGQCLDLVARLLEQTD